jgi:DNA-binding response OmpR family regulator
MAAESSAPQRLLIVEDDPHMAYLLGYLAEKERFTVETIADGRQAMARITAGPPADLVLLDVMLPYTDGFELLEKLRSDAKWKQVPVIILTSRTREHDAVRALSLGADDYLNKPFSPAELVARIRRRLKPAAAPADAPERPRGKGRK